MRYLGAISLPSLEDLFLLQAGFWAWGVRFSDLGFRVGCRGSWLKCARSGLRLPGPPTARPDRGIRRSQVVRIHPASACFGKEYAL